jgi:uncharacterized membrane protein YkoI
MKIKMIVSIGLAAALFTGCAWEKCEKCEQNKFAAEAKVSKEAAQAAALAKIPGGTVKEAEMSKWKGKPYWSFDITPATGGKAVEVAVDPNSGEVVWMSNEKKSEEKSAAKISKETAMATALAKVPGGTVKDGELEKEKGKWIWSFDISIPGSTDIKEVAVDATTGAVLDVATETAADQAKEAAEDAAAAAKKKKSEKEDKD